MSFEETQKVFSDVIEKPQLTTQLLSRPPFKFIVDIVRSVIQSTGYLEKEFTLDELQMASDDKAHKTAFLEKLITILDDGTLKQVKAVKIISGKNAEETNKMLQKLGTNAVTFKNNNGLYQNEKKAGKNKKTENKVKKTKKIINVQGGETETSDKPEKNRKGKTSSDVNSEKKLSSSKERHKSNDRQVKDKKKIDFSSKVETDTMPVEQAAKPKKSRKESRERALKRADSMIAINGDAPTSPNNDIDDPRDGEYDQLDESDQLTVPQMQNEENELFPSLKTDDIEKEQSQGIINQDDKHSSIRPTTAAAGNRPMTSMGRPGTAASRPAPPRIKKKQLATIESSQIKIELKSEIISDSGKSEDVEISNNFIMEQDEEHERPISITEDPDHEGRGALVQKIMEKKSEIEDGAALEQNEDVESAKNITVEKEKMRVLQEKLQDLTKSAYPLARLFDFANDDIESMMKELERWRSEQRRKEQNDQNIKAAGFGDSSKLYNIISNLQKEINDIKEELSKARGRVLNNDRRIQLYITSI